MDQVTEVLSLLAQFLPALAALAIVALGLWGADRFLLRRKREPTEGELLARQILMLALTGIGVVFVLLALPVGDSTRNQLLGIMGLILSGVIAFSSTTFVSNAMAGLMLRSVNSFRSGDFIRVGEQFGRVTERGLFHAEIQTEDRDLTTIPNIYLITHPVTVVHSSGTIVSANVSLGYDVPRQKIEATLIEAALQADLTDPFVQVLELGDFSVAYRVAGFLLEAKQLLTVRSTLKEKMLDALHAADIEVVSPTFTHQRQIGQKDRAMPDIPSLPEADRPREAGKAPESMMFEKAEEAEKLEQMREERKKLKQEIEDLAAGSQESELAAGEDRDARVARLERRVRQLDKQIEDAGGAAKEKSPE